VIVGVDALLHGDLPSAWARRCRPARGSAGCSGRGAGGQAGGLVLLTGNLGARPETTRALVVV
jgi:hypothetical protein